MTTATVRSIALMPTAPVQQLVAVPPSCVKTELTTTATDNWTAMILTALEEKSASVGQQVSYVTI
jgi:hypothetical protein